MFFWKLPNKLIWKQKDNIGECWKDGIDTYLRAEKIFKGKGNQAPKKELTYDFALSRLLESNKHIDEINGKILLERGLVYENDKLDYSRDITLVTGVGHHWIIILQFP